MEGGHLQGENADAWMAVTLGGVGGWMELKRNEVVRGSRTKSSAGVLK